MCRLAESRSTDPTSLAGCDNDLRTLAAFARSDSTIHYDRAKLIDGLRRVHTPVLAVVVDKDPNLAEAQVLIETVPVGELVVLPGEDHVSAVTAQGYKEAVASFLDARALSAA